jgi:murein DD-endopeptidase MepM/ murein hydrolase activator NlpD
MTTSPISHALVLPDRDFTTWYRATETYLRTFERVVVVRSPAGNDLNRYRDVSAVQVPGVWINNDALSHIRRAYPSVVRIDVIRATTADMLKQMLEERARRNDRFGEWLNDGHISDRFILRWTSDAQPARIVRAFNLDLGGGRRNEGIDVFTAPSTNIRAAAEGTVTLIQRQPNAALNYGQYVQVTTLFNNQTHVLTYTHLADISVSIGQRLRVGDVIGTAAGAFSRLVVQRPGSGSTGYVLPDVVNPTNMIYWESLRLRPTVDGLRVRERPGTESRAIAQVYVLDTLETLEMHGRTLQKLGESNSWLRVRTPNRLEGFVAGWFLQTIPPDQLTGNLNGMNLDLRHVRGAPAPERLKGLGWLRLPYKATPSQGFRTLGDAHAFYQPRLEAYARAGYRNMVILTHQTFGEGAGYVWPNMYQADRGKWRDYVPQFVEVCRQIAERYANRNLVHSYQIWNEQDTPFEFAQAAVPILPEDYAYMLTEAIKAIRSVDQQAKIITGGHMSGPFTGANYARATIAAMPSGIRPDGIACHSYGRGAPDSPERFRHFGLIDEDINRYGAILRNVPIWITEYGVLDHPEIPATEVADYGTSFIRYLRANYSRRVATAMWYAWADGMHNGYGLVSESDQPKQPLHDRYLRA